MPKRNKVIIFIVALILVSFMIIYVGHFLFSEKQDVIDETRKTNEIVPIIYKHLSTSVSNYKQEINVLEIDPKDNRVEVLPALSYNNIFGFEILSSIAIRNNAYAAINAGFFYKFGNPSGMVVLDGKIINMSTGRFPVFIISNGIAELKNIKSTISIKTSQNKINISSINAYEPTSGIILYTPEFGIDNRINSKNVSVSIINDKVTAIENHPGKVKIPKEGMLLTFLKYNIKNLPLKIGDYITLDCSPKFEEHTNAYECGSWIVKDGKIVMGKKDPWVGVMTNHDPRTIVGIKEDGRIILMTIDGRQPGISTGFTGSELGNYILNYGIKNAAMLDGGASTEMILKGKIVNKPSASGQERPVGGGIIVKYAGDNYND